MGNSESTNPVRNMDKRTARREYRDTFIEAIAQYQLSVRPRTRTADKNKRSEPKVLDWGDGNIKVFVRKRPIFKHETDNHEFDVATCLDKSIVIHDARMHADMKRQMLHHNTFEFDAVFDEYSSNESVYACSAKSLVDVTLNGGFSTCLVYGQTGSGKTFTMTSIYEKAARDIFTELHNRTDRFAPVPIVSMSFVEIAGDRCSDLLNGFTPAQLLTGPDGSVHAFPVVEPTVTGADELMAMINHGMSIRTTAATGVHDASSRSHAILRIYVNRVDTNGRSSSYGSTEAPEGTLTLVDLAGSEHRIDSMYHGKERRKETSNINASLMALKECIRARAAGKNLSHQYRKSKLTMALKASFSLTGARTIVIATVSPASKDTEHSLNTLRHACIMHGQQDTAPGVSSNASDEKRFVTGGSVVTQQIGEINLTAMARKARTLKKAGEVLEAKTNNGNNVDTSKKAKEANQEVELTDKEKERAKRAAERKAFTKLSPELKQLLTFHRTQLASEPRQLARLRRNMNDILPRAEEPVDEIDDEVDQFNEDEEEEEEEEEIEDNVTEFHNSLNKVKRVGGVGGSGGRSHVDEVVEEEEYYDDNEFEEEQQLQQSCGNSYGSSARSRSQPNHISSSSSNKSNNSRSQKSSPPPPPPKSTPPPVVSPSSRGHAAVGGAVDSRITIKSVYDSIYVAGVGSIPEEILRTQLTAIMKLHGYTAQEVDDYLYTQQYANSQRDKVRSLKGVNNSPSVAPTQSVSVKNSPPPQKIISPRTNSSSSLGLNSRRSVTNSASPPLPSSSSFVEERLQVTPRGSNAPPSSSVSGKVIHTPRSNERESGSNKGIKPNSNAVIQASSKPVGRTVAATSNRGSASQSSYDITESEKQKFREQQMLEERERKKQEALLKAKEKLEQEAAVRKQRQEAAKKLREEQEQARLAKLSRNMPKSSQNSYQDDVDDGFQQAAAKPVAVFNPYTDMDSNQFHHAEIEKLTLELNVEGISSTMKFALRKKIGEHKTALLKDKRASEIVNAPNSNHEVEPVRPAKIEPIQEEEETAEQYRRRTKPADKNRYKLPPQPVVVAAAAPAPTSNYGRGQEEEYYDTYNDNRLHNNARQDTVGVPYNRSNSGNSYGMGYDHYNEGDDYQAAQSGRGNKLDGFRNQFDSYERGGSNNSRFNPDSDYDTPSTYSNRPQALSQYTSGQQRLAQREYEQPRNRATVQDFDDVPIRGQHRGVIPPPAVVPVVQRATRHRVVGASAAPFANDYSWNNVDG